MKKKPDHEVNKGAGNFFVLFLDVFVVKHDGGSIIIQFNRIISDHADMNFTKTLFQSSHT